MSKLQTTNISSESVQQKIIDVLNQLKQKQACLSPVYEHSNAVFEAEFEEIELTPKQIAEYIQHLSGTLLELTSIIGMVLIRQNTSLNDFIVSSEHYTKVLSTLKDVKKELKENVPVSKTTH